MTPNPQAFLDSLAKYNVAIHWDEKLHVFFFRSNNENLRVKARNYLVENPELEAALLETRNMSWCGIGREDMNLRDMCYRYASLWDVPENKLDAFDVQSKYYWCCVMKWLSRYGGEVPNLPGAVRYVFNENEPRIDGQVKYPASFPKAYEEYSKESVNVI